eukprot:COSAG02_NODE_3338_length_6903_cov_13.687537_4_plen_84_part_00
MQVKEEQPLVADLLALDTDYSHILDVASDATVTIVATGSYGALYALETLVQLATSGSLLYLSVVGRQVSRPLMCVQMRECIAW